jgi:hypothetical protein
LQFALMMFHNRLTICGGWYCTKACVKMIMA